MGENKAGAAVAEEPQLEKLPALSLEARELPAELRVETTFKRLQKALEVTVPVNWPEEKNYVEAKAVKAIAEAILRPFHADLVTARIGYLFRKEWKRKGKTVRAKLSVASGWAQYVGKVDFVMEVNWTVWRFLTAAQRIALIDHELCHAWQDLDSGAWKTAVHDIEEFLPIIERWGLWEPDLEKLGATMQQLSLF